MARSVVLARKLVLAPILVLALCVVLVDATAAPRTDRGAWSTAPSGTLEKQPFGKGDARRMR